MTGVQTCALPISTDTWKHALRRVPGQNAAKKGGRQRLVEIDGVAAEARHGIEPVDHRSPEQVFDQKLAIELYKTAMRDLEAEATPKRQGEIFAAVRGYGSCTVFIAAASCSDLTRCLRRS